MRNIILLVLILCYYKIIARFIQQLVAGISDLRFESDVNLEGIKTLSIKSFSILRFESDVNLEGIKTHSSNLSISLLFESDVNLEGIKTNQHPLYKNKCLRVM